uniref:Plant heme peroxidase family profile domain-containing protein n=1 Tax=Ananas comosus var. bracteatus TaxID=296719 RepID=A0A6V7QE27_ANACO|nr:unnamed protein product [Ananas comosus var. bracteatus]
MDSKALVALFLPLALVFLSCLAEAQLKLGFYEETCPHVEDIVREEMTEILKVAPSLAGPLLRMHFHDCFVRSKGPSWPVWLGRRDGRESHAAETKQLPPPKASLPQLIAMFAVKGLDLKDLVVLSGGHTLGTSHCNSFSDRLYNFTGKDNLYDVDPALDKQYITKLRNRCSLTDNTTLVEMDPGSYKTFDTSYYNYVKKRRGLFHSDAALLANDFTKAYVERHASGLYAAEFFQDYSDSIIKMGNIEVLTGYDQGEIRKKCYISHGPFYTIPTGRRDGNGSVASDVAKYVPSPTATIDDLKAFFAKKNLTVKDLVVLSGAHTLGKAHCYSFSDRLYNFKGNGSSDPSLDANYTIALQNQCKPNDMTTLVDLDPNNATMFDLDYYKLVSNMKGLFASDVALLSDVDAKAYVTRQANATKTDEFFNDFATSMVAMGRLGVLTHQNGEIRKICSAVNPPSPPPSSPSKSSSANKRINVLVGFVLGTAELKEWHCRKDAPPNLAIRGYGSIERLKRKLEEACPETVSCADIIAMAARDSVYLLRVLFIVDAGPYYKIETGRRDGNVSIDQEVLNFLPPPISNITTLFTSFTQKGLSIKDLVVLSVLEKKCRPNDTTTLVEMDPGSSRTFDLGYYQKVAKGRGLFSSDEALLHNSITKSYLLKQAHAASSEEFFDDFVESMINMGRIEVRTGDEGGSGKFVALTSIK